jgi:serine/threonine protein kinase/tetratricopeptide (TPR) repeat protein
MPKPEPARDPLEQLAEEWRDRLRRGDRFEADEYIARHPDLAEEIRDLFPAIVMMEEFKPAAGDLTGAFAGAELPAEGPPRLERLGDFRILREVGRGGMGVVYEAEQESLGRRVALKILPGQALADRHQQKRFHREARATARLHHTNIVPVYGVGEHEGMHYYVMQFIQGAPLDQVLGELKRLRQTRTPASTTVTTPPPPRPRQPASGGTPRSEVEAADVARSLLTGTLQAKAPGKLTDSASGPRPSPTQSPPSLSGSSLRLPGQTGQGAPADSGRHYYLSVARIGIQVAEALEYANTQGIIHRDIKPSNLLLDNQGTVWVTDFGLAKALADGENLTHTGDIVGTLRYMAPERFTGQADARGDIYSLGLTLYELLVQQPAFAETDRNRLIHQVTHQEPAPPRRLNPDLPRDLETIVLKAIEREPHRRYATAAALSTDLKRFVEDKPIGARRVSTGERLWRWCRRNPALASLTAGIALLLVVLAVGASLTAAHFRRLAGQEHEAREKADAAFLTAEKARESEARQCKEAVAAREAAEVSEKKEAEQRGKAVAAQRLAEKNFQEARQAIEELLTRVSEGRLKDLPGMQPVRRELLESALTYYQRFVDRHGDDPALKKDLADAYTRVARILADIGSRKEALQTFDRALRIRTELQRRDPTSKKPNLDLVAHHRAVGNLHLRMRDADAALKSLQSAYDVLLAFSPQDRTRTANLPLIGTGIAMGIPVHASSDLDVLQAFAGVLNDMGAVVQLRDPGQAIQIYLQAVYIYRNLPGQAKEEPKPRAPDPALWQQELARQWNRIGSLMADLEMTSAALLYHKEAKGILELLSARFPGHPNFEEMQRELAGVRESMGKLHATRKLLQAAQTEYRAALEIRQRQALANPAVPDFQSDLTHCLLNLALVEGQDKGPGPALESLEKALQRQRTLVATVPDEKPYVRALARQLMHQGRLRKELGKPDEALQSYREARRLWEQLLLAPESVAATTGVQVPTLGPAPVSALHGLSLPHAALLAAPTRDYQELATVRAATGDDGAALLALQQAFVAGSRVTELVQAAPEFAALRTHKDFQAVLQGMKARHRALPWQLDLTQARKQAAREKKDLFLYFGAGDWVPSDTAFRRGLLSQDVVVDYLSKHFVPVMLDKPLFSSMPSNVATTRTLTGRWKITNFATMILADARGRAYWGSDKGSSEVASWKDAQEFLGELEAQRKLRIERDRRFAAAEKAATGSDRARLLEAALHGLPAYAAVDYQDVHQRIFLLDSDNRLGLRTKYFSQGLAARRAEILKHLEQRAWRKALEEANRTLDEFAPSGKAAQEVYLQRGQAHLGLGLFERAAADFARGQAVQSGDPEQALFQVYALVQLGDVHGYRRVCADLLKAYWNTNSAFHAFVVAWTCAMVPDAVDDWARVRALPQKFLRLRQVEFLNAHALAVVHYRSGNHAAAEQVLRQSMASNPFWPGRNQLILGLIAQRQNNSKEARQWLGHFLASFKKDDLETPHASGFRDLLVLQQFLEEAAVLFDGPPLTGFPGLQARRHRGLIYLKQWDRAAAALGERLAREPDNAQLYLERGRCYEQLKQSGKAAADFAQALKLKSQELDRARAAFDKGPKARADREALEDGYRALARLRLRLGQAQEAVVALGNLIPIWASDSERLYETARDIAALLPMLGKDPEQAQHRQVAELAATTLAKAVQGGFVDPTRLKKDGAFQPLYARADFLALWKELTLRDTFSLPPGVTLPPSPSAEVMQARDLASRRAWDQAETHYARAVAKQPGDSEVLIERGRFFARRGKWREAIRDYDAALAVAPARADGWQERGRCHAALEQWEQTAADFGKAVKLLPDNPGFFSPSSKACRELAQWQPAFARAVKLHPGAQRLWIGRARVHALRGEWSDAVACYARVIKTRPLMEEWFENAAVLLLDGKEDEYRKTRAEMIRRAGNNPAPFVAFVLARTGALRPNSPAEGAQLLGWAKTAVAASPRTGWFLHALGCANYRAGNLQQAIEHLNDSTQLKWTKALNDLFLALAHHHLGNALEARHLLESATTYLDRVRPVILGEAADEREPDWLEANVIRREVEAILNAPHRREAEESTRKGQWKEALVHLDALIRTDADFWPDRYLRGVTHSQLGQWKQAAADFARILDVHPRLGAYLWFEYACLLCQLEETAGYRQLCARMRKQFGQSDDVSEMGFMAHACVLAPQALPDPQEVVRLAKERLRMTPPPSEEHPWSVHVLGLAYYRAGDYDKAVESFSKGLDLAPLRGHHVMNWLGLALAEHKRGRAREARQWLERATTWMETMTRGLPDERGQVMPAGWTGRHWLQVQLLRREAEQIRQGEGK